MVDNHPPQANKVQLPTGDIGPGGAGGNPSPVSPTDPGITVTPTEPFSIWDFFDPWRFRNIFGQPGGSVFQKPGTLDPPKPTDPSLLSATAKLQGNLLIGGSPFNLWDLLLWIFLFILLIIGIMGLVAPSPSEDQTEQATQIAELAA